jgi:hypothetical protein
VVDAVDDVLDRLRAHGAELVGEVAQYGDIYRYCYVRGPDGIIVLRMRTLDGPAIVMTPSLSVGLAGSRARGVRTHVSPRKAGASSASARTTASRPGGRHRCLLSSKGGVITSTPETPTRGRDPNVGSEQSTSGSLSTPRCEIPEKGDVATSSAWRGRLPCGGLPAHSDRPISL